MVVENFLWFTLGCVLETIVCWYKWGRNRNTKEGTPSASHNKQSTPCSECGTPVLLSDIHCSECLDVLT